jgi:DNA-binding CsgD family transcriptional regulator
MKPPLFARPLVDEERQQLRIGLRSADAFTLRRSQILLASVGRQSPAQIAATFGCSTQTVRDAIRAFGAEGNRHTSRHPCRSKP